MHKERDWIYSISLAITCETLGNNNAATKLKTITEYYTCLSSLNLYVESIMTSFLDARSFASSLLISRQKYT